MKQKIIISILLLLLVIQSASAVATLDVGTISYDSTVVKDESITVSSSVTASAVTGTLTVDVTLTDNSGFFSITTATQQLQFTTNSTKAISWTIKATSSGTGASPFTIMASGDDGGSSNSETSISAVTVKDRPIISIIASSNATSIASGGTASISYVVSNDASIGAADATNVNVTLVNPSGWSITSGTNPYALGSIAPGASTSGSWVVRADSPAASNTLTLNAISSIPGGTIFDTLSITGPSSNGGGSSGGGGSSSGGGGGGGGSDENSTNIEVIEKYDLEISKGVLTSYRFKEPRNPIMFVNITGNASIGVVTGTVEVLKGTSTLVNAVPGGLVYKNANIWIGTLGMAVPKNIKEALIKFKVDNSWMSTNGVSASDIVLVKWDGSSWIDLETKVLSKDDTNTYLEGKTNSFSPFAIKAVKPSGPSSQLTPIGTSTQPKGEGTPKPTKTKTPGFDIVMAVVSISGLYLLGRMRR